mmetsp:Transcript_6987/g.12232  ORF Transcript_6987/g.12232 Transcript_6987/m.12232 type:complete len:293 (+) Transcript_6987:658-1536(+)
MIHDVAKVLPSSWHLKQLHTNIFCNPIESGGCGHGACHCFQILVERQFGGVCGNQRNAVGRIDEELFAEHHVAVGVAIGRCAKVKRTRFHQFHQVFCIRQIRIRMFAAEIFLRFAIGESGLIGAEFVDKDALGVRASDAVQRVKGKHKVFASKQCAQCSKVKHLLQEVRVLGSAVDHLHLERRLAAPERVLRHLRQIHRRQVARNVQRRYTLRVFVDGVCDRLGRWSAARHIVFDAEIAVFSTRVVARRQNDAAKRFACTNDRRHGRCREQTVLSDHNFAHFVSGCHLKNLL